MVYCIKCGKPNENHHNFCIECGSALYKIQKTSQQSPSKLLEHSNQTNRLVAVYKNQVLIGTKPPLQDYYEEREKFFKCRFIISDGIQYDLESNESINTIPISGFQISDYNISMDLPAKYELGFLSRLDYVLSRKATALRKEHKKELSISLQRKANQLMAQTLSYTEKDYMRLVHWLLEDYKFDEADKEMENVKMILADQKDRIKDRQKSNYKYSDLVVARTYFNSFCCEKCAKYRNRIYSVSGNDCRFQKIPVYDCSCNGLLFQAYYESINSNENIDNSRPFTDNRTPQEKENFQNYLKELKEKSYDYDLRKAYYRLKQLIPNEIPKSYSAFKRARNNNSDKFQSLIEKACQFEIYIPKKL